MSKQLLIQMLRKGSTGEQILSILDVITNDTVTEEQPESYICPGGVSNLNEIAF
jgi:hypothetical protein